MVYYNIINCDYKQLIILNNNGYNIDISKIKITITNFYNI